MQWFAFANFQDGFAVQVVTDRESVVCRISAARTLCATAPNDSYRLLANLPSSDTTVLLARQHERRRSIVEWDLAALTVDRWVRSPLDALEVGSDTLPDVAAFDPGWPRTWQEHRSEEERVHRAGRARAARTTRERVGTLQRSEPEWRAMLGAGTAPTTLSVAARPGLSVVSGSFDVYDESGDACFLAIRWRGRWHWGRPEAEHPGLTVHAASERAGALWLTASDGGAHHGAWTHVHQLVMRPDAGVLRNVGRLTIGVESWAHNNDAQWREEALVVLNSVAFGSGPCVEVRRELAWSAIRRRRGRWQPASAGDLELVEVPPLPVGFWRPGWAHARRSCER